MTYFNGSSKLCLVDRSMNGLSVEMFDDADALLEHELRVWLCRNTWSGELAGGCERRLRAMAQECMDRIIAEFIESEYGRNNEDE